MRRMVNIIVLKWLPLFCVIKRVNFTVNHHRIVKNGGTVQFKDQTDAITDYNQLQDDHVHGTSKLWKVDGSESSIMSLGFHHFKGCHFVEKIRLHRCKYMENDGLEKLGYLKNSLKELEVTECHNVEKDALLSLKQLQCLKILTIHGFTYINDDDFKTVSNELQKNLPNCQIITKV